MKKVVKKTASSFRCLWLTPVSAWQLTEYEKTYLSCTDPSRAFIIVALISAGIYYIVLR